MSHMLRKVSVFLIGFSLCWGSMMIAMPSTFAQGPGNIEPEQRLPSAGLLDRAGPQVRAEGAVELQNGFSVDLDTGDVGLTSGDVQFLAPAGEDAILVPVNGAKWVRHFGLGQPTYQSCTDIAGITWGTPAFTMSRVSIGDDFCVYTKQGRYGILTIEGIRPLLRRLTVSFTLWE